MSNDKAVLSTVRPVERRDVEAILDIERRSHDGAAVADKRRWAAEADLTDFVGEDRTRLFVLEASGRVVGYLAFDARDEEEARLVRLTVDPGLRRKGYGTVLLECGRRLARAAKARRLAAYAYEEDLDAQMFFRAKGLRGWAARRHYGKKDAVRFAEDVTK